MKNIIISNFNLDFLGKMLYSNKIYSLNNFYNGLQNKNNFDFGIIWTTPNIIKEFNKIERNEKYNIESLYNQLYDFYSSIEIQNKNIKFIFIPTWNYKPKYLSDLNNDISYFINLMNYKLYERFKNNENIFILDSNKWLNNCKKQPFNNIMQFRAKMPFNIEILKLAKKDILNYINSIYGLSKKMIILDLDNTLWGGVIGDDGIDKIKLGGHDDVGEAFVEFQKYLKLLKNRGILLSIASKNTEEIALHCINNHPEMILKESDFVSIKCNWNQKIENIKSIISEININPDSIVFIDDNYIERELVKKEFPNILVVDLPESPLEYLETIENLNVFTNITNTEEDKNRTESYIANKKIENIKNKYNNIESVNKELNLEVSISKIDNINFDRCLQLLNKTNQMNLSTRRLSKLEFKTWINNKNNSFYYVKAKDNINNYGIIGLLSFSNNQIIDFILSCRAMGRDIEKLMLYFIYNVKKSSFDIKIKPTNKNTPMFLFLKNYSECKDNIFTINKVEKPKWIKSNI